MSLPTPRGDDMVTHMKTTIDIADNLLAQAKDLAHKEKTTLRALTEEGLRHVVNLRRRPGRKRKIRLVTFGGKTPPEAFRWSEMRKALYGE